MLWAWSHPTSLRKFSQNTGRDGDKTNKQTKTSPRLLKITTVITSKYRHFENLGLNTEYTCMHG